METDVTSEVQTGAGAMALLCDFSRHQQILEDKNTHTPQLYNLWCASKYDVNFLFLLFRWKVINGSDSLKLKYVILAPLVSLMELQI